MIREKTETSLSIALRTARASKRLSLAAVANQTGISVATISQIETGYIRDPGARTLYRLARCYDLGVVEVWAALARDEGG